MDPKFMKYAENIIVDNIDDVYSIIEMSQRELQNKFDMKTKHPEMVLTAFALTFEAFVKKLKERADAGYNKYKIIIANRVEIGFDNAEGEDYEKNGGFMFYIKHLYYNAKDDDSNREYEDTTITLCTTWNSINITTDSQIIREVAIKAVDDFKKYDIVIQSHEAVMPIFATVYDNIVTYIKLQRANNNEFEYEVNFAGLFSVRSQASDDLDDIIAFTPAIDNKLLLKSDSGASSKFDAE